MIAWFAFLIIVPCGAFTLLFNNEIVIGKSAVPDDELRLWMISTTENRGIGFANGYITRNDGGQICTRTDLNFLLWKGTPPDKKYSCTCYEKKGQFYSATSMDDQTCLALK